MAAQIHVAQGPPKLVVADGGNTVTRVMRVSNLRHPASSRSCAACRAGRASDACTSSELSESSSVASPGEFAPLRLGNMKIDPPLLVAPMVRDEQQQHQKTCLVPQ